MHKLCFLLVLGIHVLLTHHVLFIPFVIIYNYQFSLTDYGLTQFAPKDKAAFDKKRASELLNGRLAMIAIGGIATQTVITGHGFPYV